MKNNIVLNVLNNLDKLFMPFSAIVTPDDLKRGDLVDPGWYPCEVSKYEEKEAGTDKSINCIFNYKVLDGPSKGNVFMDQFNEKALGFGKKLWPVLGIPYDKEKGFQLSTPVLKATEGKKLKVYIVRAKSSKGNDFNKVEDYAPLT